jgi:hypothetical protein
MNETEYFLTLSQDKIIAQLLILQGTKMYIKENGSIVEGKIKSWGIDHYGTKQFIYWFNFNRNDYEKVITKQDLINYKAAFTKAAIL